MHTRSSRILPVNVSRALLVLGMLTVTSCSLFSVRTPEDPESDGGTFIQPDTPEQVIENIRAAISELNALSYRRSFSESFVFHPTASAIAREPIFLNWTRAQEEQYFTAMVSAATQNGKHVLVLNDQSYTILNEKRVVLDATYVLTISHRRVDVPTEVQGRLQWLVLQGPTGLWELTEWTDQELGSTPSWSDLKAAFVK
jgi:hypothetical protein